MASSINMTPTQKMETIVTTLAKLYPDAGFTFGYIGNCKFDLDNNPVNDDRGWYVFTQLLNEKGKDINFGGWSTENMPLFLQSCNANIVAWVNCVKEVLAAEQADKDALAAGKSVKYRRYRK